MKQVLSTPEELRSSISLLQPTRPIFCCTKMADGQDHVAPFAWIIPISCDKPRLALALQNERGKKYSQSLQNIERTKEFVICMPTMGQEHELVRASFMPEEGQSKFERTGYTRQESRQVEPPAIGECPACLECKVFQFIDHGGDHTILLADIVSASYDPACYDAGLAPKIPQMLPLINLSERRYDDHQEHYFLDTTQVRHITVYYDKTRRQEELDESLQETK